MLNALETDDVQLTAGDIGLLENATQIISFFARLRYDVDNAAPLSHAALNMDTDELRYQVRAIYQVATDPDEEIRVYLMEVRSVTVRLKHMLAQRFRDRSGELLLVLTDDGYETFDFVLLERALAKSAALGQTAKQVIRPRSLTVSRRNPEPVALRVLRRFTYTEADYLFQWEKLRSAFTLAEWSEPYFNNRALFSDYYLKNRLADSAITPAWDEDVRPTGRAVFDLLGDARRRFSGRPEAEIRAGLIEPLLQQLGFALVPVRDARSSAERPDYFLRDPADPDGPNLAAALTSVWNRNLDDVDPTRDPDTPDEIPGARVVSVLEQGDAPWVIMTNGKLWRLYAAAADNKATNYYEVDLEEALYADDRLAALKYWWLLFRRQAFGGGLLDTVLQASQEYAKELGERLKERIFVEIFPHFARGFIANARRRQPAAPLDDAFLQQTFAGTLTFLYRLMFILYAESLELLPVVEARGYGEHSLRRLKREIADKAGTIRELAPEQIRAAYRDGDTNGAGGDALYARLQALFAAINDGRADWNLPVYNGGLFSPESDAGRFLAQQAIPDRHLALGLDLLARDVDEKSQALAFIDYKDLGVRHLGSIYEGLLEFRLRIATEPLVVVKEKGRERYLPAAEAGSRRAVGTVAPGEVYLENDKRERKATGSYYTPDYIVKYIVEHTVGPVLERKFEALAPRLRDAQRQYRQHKQRVTGRGGDQDPANFWNKTEMQRLADACLDVRVLDPAMGSGHFLVEVVDYTSNRLLDFLNGWSENPVWGMLEQMRRDILKDVDEQGVSIDAGRLTRVALLKRSVLKRCIYGVDLNEMAVELAKVSLWLDAFTLGAPLSFLDHHLKQGNSLIGARIREVEEAVAGAQRDLFTPQHFVQVGQAVQGMREVSFRPDNTPEQVAASRQQYRSALQNVAPLKRVLDVYTSRWFGNEPSKAFDPALYFLQQPEALAWRKEPATPLPERGGVDLQAIADTTLQARAAHHFFHWELEFPEVFFAPSAAGGQDVELREDGGFDAVVGNPPYQRVQGIKEFSAEAANYFEDTYPAATGSYDIYILFDVQGVSLLSSTGQLGFIQPHKFFQAQFASEARKQLAQHVARVVNFQHNLVFADASTYTCLLFLSSSKAETTQYIEIGNIDNSLGDKAFEDALQKKELIEARTPTQEDEIWLFGSKKALSILEKLTQRSTPLGKLTRKIFVGLQTSADSIYFLEHIEDVDNDRVRVYSRAADEEFILEKLFLKPLLRGKDVARYTPPTAELWVIFPYSVSSSSAKILSAETLQLRSPRLWSYLKRFEAELRGRESGKMDGPTWWEYGRSNNLFEFEEQPRLLSPDICARGEMTIDQVRQYHTTTVYSVVLHKNVQLSLYYILAILNSRLIWFYLEKTGTDLRGGYLRFKTKYLEPIPIKEIDFEAPKSVSTSLVGVPDPDLGAVNSKATYDAVDTALAAGRYSDVHHLLAKLAQQMERLNRTSQSEIRQFLGWLQERLVVTPHSGRSGLVAFSGHTIIQNYLGDYQKGEPELPWSEMEYRLYQNRGRFAANWADVRGEVQAEYEKSLATLRPIKQRLAETDALIDKIVYRLYGLTDDEIRLIEQPAYEQALAQAKEAVAADRALQQDPEQAAAALADRLLPAAQRLLQRVETAAERAALDAALPGWERFPGDVPTFLLTGEYNIRHQPDHLDFSTSIVSYAKAVETMLFRRLFAVFREESGRDPAAAHGSILREFLDGTRDRLTLGAMRAVLSSSQEKALRRFAAARFHDDAARLFGDAGVIALLADESVIALRNAAVHDEVMTRADAQAARAWALGVLEKL